MMDAPKGPRTIRIKCRADIIRAIEQLEAEGEPASLRVPLFQALHLGSIAYTEVSIYTTSRYVKNFLAIAKEPTVIVLADDGEEAGIPPVGPNGFKSTRRLMEWANFVFIHGTGGQRAHYCDAVDLAKTTRRLLFIEAQSRSIPAYQAAAARWGRGAKVQTFQPFPGQQHPIAPFEVST